MSQYITFQAFSLLFSSRFLRFAWMCSSLMENQRRKKNCFCNKSQIFITTVRRQRRKMYLRHLKLSLKDISGFIIFSVIKKSFSFAFASLFEAVSNHLLYCRKKPKKLQHVTVLRNKRRTLGRVSHINTFITTINLGFFSVSVASISRVRANLTVLSCLISVQPQSFDLHSQNFCFEF